MRHQRARELRRRGDARPDDERADAPRSRRLRALGTAFPRWGYIGLGSRRLANLRPMVDDLLSESQVRKRGRFRPEVVRKYVNEQRRGAEDWSMQIWQLLTLEIWTQFFLDGGARSFAQRQIGAQQLTTA